MDFLPKFEIEVSAQTYERVYFWRNIAWIACAAAFVLYLLPIQSWLNTYLLFPAFASYRKGSWTKDPRFLAHCKMMEKKFSLRKGDGHDEEDDEDCPELIPDDYEFTPPRQQKKANEKNEINYNKKGSLASKGARDEKD